VRAKVTFERPCCEPAKFPTSVKSVALVQVVELGVPLKQLYIEKKRFTGTQSHSKSSMMTKTKEGTDFVGQAIFHPASKFSGHDGFRTNSNCQLPFETLLYFFYHLDTRKLNHINQQTTLSVFH
jgi:hypothetical protein